METADHIKFYNIIKVGFAHYHHAEQTRLGLCVCYRTVGSYETSGKGRRVLKYINGLFCCAGASGGAGAGGGGALQQRGHSRNYAAAPLTAQPERAGNLQTPTHAVRTVSLGLAWLKLARVPQYVQISAQTAFIISTDGRPLLVKLG
ncbi:jg1339 [Pararge aegeria aegeria]|uniref:Jg1339 protein n=1 Tax=Pararge aegeria aegeria TaxID=348720 RepID=A0A8S4S3Z3_9NEOP|nr:jg1339 [Pararge aegeria aegeria]